MKYYDLCLAWNWEYDSDFVTMLEAACLRRGRSMLQVTSQNLASVNRDLETGRLYMAALFDRASDSDEAFLPVVEWAARHRLPRINRRDRAERAWDKATMHSVFLQAGIRTPRTLILPAFSTHPDLPAVETSVLGATFVIKPACQGGGDGVVKGARSTAEVAAARQLYPQDRYLLQACAVPATLGTRQAWFRVISCLGHAFLCWWDPGTHTYTTVATDEEIGLGLGHLRGVVRGIQHLCGLELFSTEIALTAQGDLVAVDYVNDPIDLRLQSRVPEGVPDSVVGEITERVGAWL